MFDTRGIAFAAWTLAAFSIGALAGMLIRRVVPAMAATLAAYTGLALVTWGIPAQALPAADGHQQPQHRHRPPHPQLTVGARHVADGPGGRTHWWSYLPVSRFWPLQFVEAGWLLALSVPLIAATVWLIRRRPE